MGSQIHFYIPVKKLYPIYAMHIPEFLLRYKNLVYFTQQGIEKLNDKTTVDFAKSTNHNYHNLQALKQLMTKHKRVPKQKICSVCKEKAIIAVLVTRMHKICTQYLCIQIIYISNVCPREMETLAGVPSLSGIYCISGILWSS